MENFAMDIVIWLQFHIIQNAYHAQSYVNLRKVTLFVYIKLMFFVFYKITCYIDKNNCIEVSLFSKPRHSFQFFIRPRVVIYSNLFVRTYRNVRTMFLQWKGMEDILTNHGKNPRPFCQRSVTY